MKKLFLSITLIFFLVATAFSQGRYHALGVTAGLSYFNSKLLTLSWETENGTKLNVGALVEGLYYNKFSTGKLNMKTDNRYLSAGLFLTIRLHQTRNFSNNAYLGGAIGTDNKSMLWYPFLGFKQTYFISNSIQIISSEKLSYYQEKYFITKSLQPALLVGLQFQL